jgi:hypothetical protein
VFQLRDKGCDWLPACAAGQARQMLRVSDWLRVRRIQPGCAGAKGSRGPGSPETQGAVDSCDASVDAWPKVETNKNSSRI